jgi:hypothetical protein
MHTLNSSAPSSPSLSSTTQVPLRLKKRPPAIDWQATARSGSAREGSGDGAGHSASPARQREPFPAARHCSKLPGALQACQHPARAPGPAASWRCRPAGTLPRSPPPHLPGVARGIELPKVACGAVLEAHRARRRPEVGREDDDCQVTRVSGALGPIADPACGPPGGRL